jgi:alkyldihydroxyacetonephosphate synthase
MTRIPQEDIVHGVSAIVGPNHVSTKPLDRMSYSVDFWPKTQIWKMAGDVARYKPDAIVWPADRAEVVDLIKYCHAQHVAVVPYGAGSGVCGGTIPIHGGLTVDVKRMNKVISIDHESLTVHAEAGINGQHLEDQLNAVGLTLGHFPSSIMCSTLGGWLACRSAGQFSSRYGKIEDMVLSLSAVIGDGRVLDTAQRTVGEPNWTQLLVGSEGTLGIITDAHLKVHPYPESRLLRGWRFKHLPDALQGMRTLMQSGLKPMVLRLYDPFDSLMALGKGDGEKEPQGGFLDGLSTAVGILGDLKIARSASSIADRLFAKIKNGAVSGALATPMVVNRIIHSIPSPCLLIVGFEGKSSRVQDDMWRGSRILRETGGSDAGSKPGEHWLRHRYDVSFKQSKVYAAGGFVDTMEVATTWDRLYHLFTAVREAVSPLALVMAHFSHAYPGGCSIYFTFAAFKRDAAAAEAHYDRLWNTALKAVTSVGATVSHHHGVGLSKKGAMAAEHGEMLRVWRAVKDALDPHGILNPGKLFPDGAGRV